jgi:inhibitor of cysteine peptidase
MIVVGQNQAGQTIDLPIGQDLELRLAENPTTGYRWIFARNGAPACLVMSDRYQRPGGPPGRGGQHTWQIKAIAVGACDIAMQHTRSFEPNAAAGSF